MYIYILIFFILFNNHWGAFRSIKKKSFVSNIIEYCIKTIGIVVSLFPLYIIEWE